MKLVVFDLDGTLTRTMAVCGQLFIQSLQDIFGIDTASTEWHEYEHVTEAAVLDGIFRQRFGRSPSPAELATHITHFVQLLERRRAVDAGVFGEVPGAGAFLARLRGSDWSASIATGGWERSARFKCRAADLDVDDVPSAFAEDGPSREQIVRTAIKRASCVYGQPAFERVVAVGDARWDVRTARNLDLPLVGIADASDQEKLRALGVSHVAENYLDGPRFLRYLDEAAVPAPVGD